jgi:hypothetical protein
MRERLTATVTRNEPAKRSQAMPTIVIRIVPRLLTDPDLDLRYVIPDTLKERTGGLVTDAGYDYEFDGEVTGDEAMQIYLQTADLGQALPAVVSFLQTERLFGNDLAAAATVGVSEAPPHEATVFTIRYPEGQDGAIHAPRTNAP